MLIPAASLKITPVPVVIVRPTTRGPPSWRPTTRGPLSKGFWSERSEVARFRPESSKVAQFWSEKAEVTKFSPTVTEVSLVPARRMELAPDSAPPRT